MALMMRIVGRLWGAGLGCLPLGSRVLWVIKGVPFGSALGSIVL